MFPTCVCKYIHSLHACKLIKWYLIWMIINAYALFTVHIFKQKCTNFRNTNKCTQTNTLYSSTSLYINAQTHYIHCTICISSVMHIHTYIYYITRNVLSLHVSLRQHEGVKNINFVGLTTVDGLTRDDAYWTVLQYMFFILQTSLPCTQSNQDSLQNELLSSWPYACYMGYMF